MTVSFVYLACVSFLVRTGTRKFNPSYGAEWPHFRRPVLCLLTLLTRGFKKVLTSLLCSLMPREKAMKRRNAKFQVVVPLLLLGKDLVTATVYVTLQRCNTTTHSLMLFNGRDFGHSSPF